MRLIQALKGHRPDRTPVWFLRQAGRYLPEYRAVRAKAGGFLDLVFNADAAAEVTLQPIDRFDMDAAILFSDILVTPYAMGQKLWFAEGEGPRLGPLDDLDDDDSQAQSRLSPIMETVASVRSRLPADKALIGFAGAPWTVATYMVAGRGTNDQAPARTMAWSEPDQFQAVIDRLVSVTTQYLADQAAAGADALMLFDSWAGSLSPTQFDRWVLRPTKSIVDALREQCPGIPIIGFPRGAGQHAATYAATGVDAMHLDETVSLTQAAAVQQHLCVQGNLDPKLMGVGGSALEQETISILQALRAGPHVFNLGHGLSPDSKAEAVKQAVTLVHGYQGD